MPHRPESTFFVDSQRDVDNLIDNMIDALQRGFEIRVIMPAHGWASDNASFIQERVMAEAMQAVRGKVLKRAHLNRIEFSVRD